jgi:hypothetical protein
MRVCCREKLSTVGRGLAAGGRLRATGLLVLGAALLLALPSASAQHRNRDGSLEIAGRTVGCGGVEVTFDRKLDIEGIAESPDVEGEPGRIVINPRLLAAQPETVRLFVFYHECGHHKVGDGELDADCWAVTRGVRESWLDRRGLEQICQFFADEPKSPTHPAGTTRCRHMDRCFTTAVAGLGKATGSAGIAQTPQGTRAQTSNGWSPTVKADGPIGKPGPRAAAVAVPSSGRAQEPKAGAPPGCGTKAKADAPGASGDPIGRLMLEQDGKAVKPAPCP